jgi:hypothetical protein
MPPFTTRTVVWLSLDALGAEYVALLRDADGFRVSGHWAGIVDAEPGHARYRMALDRAWGLRRLSASWESATGRTRLRLERTADGGWRVNGRPRADLDRCVDVDMSWTPLTNTLPIRRLKIAVGAHRDFTMAYIAAPRLTVSADRQRYTRLSERRWRYESLDADFVAEFTVDDDGLVIDYPPLFRRASIEANG